MITYYTNKKFETTSPKAYHSPDGHYICIFEGTLINSQDLREKLEKIGVHISYPSTEKIILELYRNCCDSFAEELRGKFAVVIFDYERQQLIVARDRYGVCPLYYKLVDGGICIASELTEFKFGTRLPLDGLDKLSLWHYFSYGYVPEEDTYLEKVYHVPAGCLLKYDDIGGIIYNYFADMMVIEGSDQQLVDDQEFKEIVTESICARIDANKMVGIFYTGKAEERVLAAIAKQAGCEVKLFSVEFDKRCVVDEKIEAYLIRQPVSATGYWRAAIDATQVMDVPLADSSAPVDFLLSRLASKFVDVILCPDGADVMFGGFGMALDRLKRRTSPIFTENAKEALLKFEGHPWKDISDPYLLQILDLDSLSRCQTLDLNTRLKGSTVLKSQRLTAHHGLGAEFPFLDDKILNVANFLTNDEKKDMFLFKQIFEDEIFKFGKYKKKDIYKIPLATWIRTDLYENIKEVFEQGVVEEFFNTEILFTMLEQHRKGFRDLSRRIWAVTIFIIWLGKFIK